MKGLYTILIFLLLCICSDTSIAFSQPTKLATKKASYRIGLFAPLYLDSAFDQQAVYRYPSKTFPKYITPGLELVEGAMLALDTLNKLKASIELIIHDTRSAKESLRKQLDNVSAQNLDLILTHCTTSELQTLAAFGYEKNIPIVNVNLPNDAGITNNPFLVLLNSTLRTQSVAISRYVQTKLSKQRVVVFRKKGMLEDLIRSYWDEFAKTNKVKAVISASAVGWYGQDSGKPFVETDPVSMDFLGETCKAWEESIDQVQTLGKRLVKFRLGLALSNEGGALVEFKRPARLGVAAVLGTITILMEVVSTLEMVDSDKETF